MIQVLGRVLYVYILIIVRLDHHRTLVSRPSRSIVRKNAIVRLCLRQCMCYSLDRIVDIFIPFADVAVLPLGWTKSIFSCRVEHRYFAFLKKTLLVLFIPKVRLSCVRGKRQQPPFHVYGKFSFQLGTNISVAIVVENNKIFDAN